MLTFEQASIAVTRVTDKSQCKIKIELPTGDYFENHTLDLGIPTRSLCLLSSATNLHGYPNVKRKQHLRRDRFAPWNEREDVLTKLKAFYRLTKMQADGDYEKWMVRDNSGDKTSLPLIGTVRFTAGKLTYVSRRWSRGDEGNFEFAQLFRAAMEQIGKEGHHKCTFTIPTSRTPTSEFTYVDLYCGPKIVEIAIVDVSRGEGAGHYVSIDEVLTSEEN